MKYLKTFEKVNDKLKIDDYVICHEKLYNSDDGIQNFINNNIGKFVKKVEERTIADNAYGIEYDDIPEDLLNNFDLDWRENPRKPIRWMKRKEIKCWSKDKKELERKITENKYNL